MINNSPDLPPTIDAWRPIHYLGSKLRVVDPIAALLDQVDPRRGRLCDLFAGSGTVSAAMAPHRAITAVDIQEYSRVLCAALLMPASISLTEAGLFHHETGEASFSEELRWIGEALIQYEQLALEEAKQGRFDLIFDLIEFGPIAGYERGGRRSDSGIKTAMHKTHLRLLKSAYAKGPKGVVLRHFGGTYFSYAQAIDLTVLLEKAVSGPNHIRNTAVAAVLSTASDIVNTVGKQFAQPIRPRDETGRPKTHLLKKIIKDRSTSAVPVFLGWLEKYGNLIQTKNDHRILRADCIEALTHHCDGVSVVYADPPYTRDHYSRFYHVLETMSLRDDPEIATTRQSTNGPIGRGVYRIDRHQSSFCIKSQAPLAFSRLFEEIRRMEVPLVLSYSPLADTEKPRPRVIDTLALRDIAAKYFKRVEIVSAGRISHNKLNKSSLNSDVTHDAELFFVCS